MVSGSRVRTCADREPEVSRRKQPSGRLPGEQAAGSCARRRNTARTNAAPEGNPMSMGGRALHPPGKRPRHHCPCLLLPPVVLEKISTAATRTLLLRTLLLRTPWSAPIRPWTPRKNAKNPAPSPRFAGPAPTAATMGPDAFGQYPAGPRSEDDPCLGLRRRRTGGALAPSLSGIGATRSIPLWGIRRDFFVIP